MKHYTRSFIHSQNVGLEWNQQRERYAKLIDVQKQGTNDRQLKISINYEGCVNQPKEGIMLASILESLTFGKKRQSRKWIVAKKGMLLPNVNLRKGVLLGCSIKIYKHRSLLWLETYLPDEQKKYLWKIFPETM